MCYSLSTVNIEELREKLLEDAKKKAEKIIADAKAEAEKIIRNAEKEWREKAEKEREKIIRNARLEAQKIISEAHRQARIIISSAKHEIVKTVFSEAEKRLRERRGIDIKSSLKNLLEEALEYIEEPAEIIINSRDRDIINEILSEKRLKNVRIIINDRIIGGLVLVSRDGKKVDNTYDTRLKRAKTVLLTEITRILWG
jgi:V/A-type H+-transporting ATPase subunit E